MKNFVANVNAVFGVIRYGNEHLQKSVSLNSLITRGPGPGPYIDNVLYEGPRAGALRFGANSVNCRHGNTFCSVHL